MLDYGSAFNQGTLLWIAVIVLVVGFVLYRTHKSVSNTPVVRESYYNHSQVAEDALGWVVVLTVIIIAIIVLAGAFLAWLST